MKMLVSVTETVADELMTKQVRAQMYIKENVQELSMDVINIW